jgi:hypothetical protein
MTGQDRGGSSAAHIEDFSVPNADSIGGISVTRLPPGEALGAGDLETWSHRRSGGWSGVSLSKDEWKRLKRWEREAQKKHSPHRLTQREAAAAGTLVEKTATGWVVSLQNGKMVGPFKNRHDAWDWINRQPSPRYGR